MKNNLKAMPNNNSSSHNKAIFTVLVVVAVLLAAAIGLSFSDLLFPISTAPTDSEYAGASLGGIGASPTLGNQTNCTDSDGGIMPYTFGIVKYKGKNYYDKCWYAPGNSTNYSNSVVEYYCLNNTANSTLASCPGGCSKGACMNMSFASLEYTLDYTASDCYAVCIRYYSESYCWDKCYFPQGV